MSVTVVRPPAPTAGPVNISTPYNSGITFNLAPGGIFTSTAQASQPAYGLGSIAGTTGTYTPSGSYSGQDSFQYTVSGPGGPSTAGTISITVTPIPLSVPSITASTGFNTTYNVWPTITGGPNPSLVIAAGPSHGAASVSPGGAQISFVPNTNFYGTDSFTYYAKNSLGNSANATITVTVATPPAPVAYAGTINTQYATSTSQALGVTGFYSSLAIYAGAQHGSASISGTTATYTPAAGFYGNDAFSFYALGPGGNSSPATISVVVATPGAPSVNETTYYKYTIAGAVQPGSTPDLQITPQSGPAPYTYTWRMISGDTALTVGTTTGANVFAWQAPLDSVSHSGVWQATVTDAAGVQTVTPQIKITVERDQGNPCKKC